jgi:HK97 family phage prohead protease
MKEQFERRFIPFESAELRADGELEMTGYAAVFNVPATIAGMWDEEVAPGAYSKTIQENDIRALFNHDPNIVLGRNKAKTLELEEDGHGLHVRLMPPDNAWGRPVVDAVKRGDITGMSISFRAIKFEWRKALEGSKELDRRVIREAKLFDVSPVTFPAFESTSISARAAEYGLDEETDNEFERAVRLVACSQRGMPLSPADYTVIKAACERLSAMLPKSEPPVTDTGHSDAKLAPEPGIIKIDHSRMWRSRMLTLMDLELSLHQNVDH